MSSAVGKKALYKRKQQLTSLYTGYGHHIGHKNFQHPHLLLLFQQQIYFLLLPLKATDIYKLNRVSWIPEIDLNANLQI